MFDTHCHLNFKSFDGQVDEVVRRAYDAGVGRIVVPGTDVETSKKAVEIAEKQDGIYAAVGIHPHHVKQYQRSLPAQAGNIKYQKHTPNIKNDLMEIEKLLSNPEVVAIGEIGLDRHQYQKTKHKDYKVNEEFINLQKELLIEQIKLAYKYKKALVFHNREAKKDILGVLTSHQPLIANYRSVFHCCEPDLKLLEFAKINKMFIGVDGDVTYWDKKLYGFALSKQEFIKQVPLEMLVLETDSPFLTPKIVMMRSHHNYNEPMNIKIIAEFIAELKNIPVEEVIKITTENAKKLFNI
ncbi:MAG: Mg-dependent DNase [Candidatus Roizmanbacteria bacterium GW2011_GWA2_35_8]|uniref:Mg-dependent DNase n=1 Tax=Candidatus Roizmanbacteria bacterium GW2011_GWA2_35_8 TaxID=1618479 RepID=A0A0G0G2J8_9BACT|nr:MAG: Mg-dependent DNase [Candidatus Roizmanbacteria bacterium GW2011_GWA2_35_8]